MSKEADEYAKKLADSQKFEHSESEDGENLVMGCSSEEDDEFGPEDATRHW